MKEVVLFLLLLYFLITITLGGFTIINGDFSNRAKLEKRIAWVLFWPILILILAFTGFIKVIGEIIVNYEKWKENIKDEWLSRRIKT